MEVKNSIKTTLLEHRKMKLESVLLELEQINDDEFFLQQYFLMSEKLVSEGYDISEITSDEVKSKLDNLDWNSIVSGGMLSAAKEYAIRFILTSIFGVSPNIATTLSQALADFSPTDLLKVFKGEAECRQGMPNILDILIEVVVRNVASGYIGSDRNDYSLLSLKGLSTSSLGNVFGEVIRDSDISEKMSVKFCSAIH
jgi:hypothetical protein